MRSGTISVELSRSEPSLHESLESGAVDVTAWSSRSDNVCCMVRVPDTFAAGHVGLSWTLVETGVNYVLFRHVYTTEKFTPTPTVTTGFSAFSACFPSTNGVLRELCVCFVVFYWFLRFLRLAPFGRLAQPAECCEVYDPPGDWITERTNTGGQATPANGVGRDRGGARLGKPWKTRFVFFMFFGFQCFWLD